MLSAHYRD